MKVVPYEDPAAVLLLEDALHALRGRSGSLPRCPEGCYEVMGAVEGCCVRLVQAGARRFVHVFAVAARPVVATPDVLREINRLNAEILGARLFLVGETFTVSAELPLSAITGGELVPAIRLVTEAVLVAGFLRPPST